MDIHTLIPSDTPLHVQKIQIDMVLLKSNEERLRQCCNLTDFAYTQTMNLLKKQLQTNDPHILKLAYIEAVYKDDISPQYLAFIKSKHSQIKSQNYGD